MNKRLCFSSVAAVAPRPTFVVVVVVVANRVAGVFKGVRDFNFLESAELLPKPIMELRLRVISELISDDFVRVFTLDFRVDVFHRKATFGS